MVVLNPDEYQGFLGIAGQGTSFQQAGYPLSSEIRLQGGSMIRLGEGDPYHSPSAMLKKSGGQWYWVPSYFWQEYSGKLGGPDGTYGYPASQQEPLDNGPGPRRSQGASWRTTEEMVNIFHHQTF